MKNLIKQHSNSVCILPEKLDALLSAGFKRIDDCIFFSSLFPEQNIPAIEFVQHAYGDLTGYECMINKLHLEDYCESQIFINSHLFVLRFIEAWKTSFKTQAVAILSYEENGEFGDISVFRFHLKRPGEFFIDTTAIEKYPDPILVVDIH
ncbi:hypothetical protein [Paraburkholderia jirisanensis]